MGVELHASARVLVVDDEPSNREMIATTLTRSGYQIVRGVEDPREVLALVQEFVPDIVLLDVTMPWLDGFQVLAQLRGLPLTRDVPVLMLTGDASSATRRRALAAGANDYVNKPFDPAEVVQRVGNLLETRFLQLELHAHNRLLELTVQKRTAELAKYVQVLDAVRDEVAVLDPDTLRIQYANAAFAAALGRTPSDVVGVEPWELRPEWTEEGIRRRRDEVDRSPDLTVRFDTDMPHAAGGVRASEVLLQRIRTPDGDDVLVSVARDLGPRQEAEAALRAALEHEQQARTKSRMVDEMKDAFLSAISHEIRTPLTVVLAAALTLERRGMTLDPARTALLVERLADNAQRLDRLLEDLLDLSRRTRIDLPARRTFVQVDELVHEMVAAAGLDDRPVRLLTPPARAHLDEDKLRRIMAHLLDNVKEHTPAGTPVRITVAQRGEAVHVTVADAGPGIPDTLKPLVFEPFRHASATGRHSPGVGIGLALVATYAGVHGGSSWVEDEPGGGTAVHVLLPGEAPSATQNVGRRNGDLAVMLHEERSAS